MNILAPNPSVMTSDEAERIANSISFNSTRPTTEADQKAFAGYEDRVRPLVLRIEFQILATQYCEYIKASSQGEKAQWMKRMIEKIYKIERNIKLLPQPRVNFFVGLTATPEVYSALSVGSESWCEPLIQKLTQLFLKVSANDGWKETADIGKWLGEWAKTGK
jgi:hypothetical protein